MEVSFKPPEYTAKSETLFSAKSYLIDRFTAAVEEIKLPEYILPTGDVRAIIKAENITFSKLLSRKRKVILSIAYQGSPLQIPNRTVIDFRCDSPANWSHSLNFHVPFAFYLKDVFATVLEEKEALFLLPSNTPNYIKELFELFGLEVEYTDRPVKANNIEFEISPFDCLRGIARNWVEEYLAHTSAYNKIQTKGEFEGKKFFLSRKDSRKVVNEDQVAGFLSSNFGYEKVYAEDFSVTEQIGMFMHSDDIAAIHGAAIGPLLYRPHSSKKMSLLEIFSPGHMTNFYRGTSDQVGVNWVGVRGRIESTQIDEAYRFDKPYLKYSLSDFYVDLDSLEKAVNYLKES